MVQLLKTAPANDVVARVFVLADIREPSSTVAVDVVSQIGFSLNFDR